MNELVLPSFLTDNYFTLLPGDEKQVGLDLTESNNRSSLGRIKAGSRRMEYAAGRNKILKPASAFNASLIPGYINLKLLTPYKIPIGQYFLFGAKLLNLNHLKLRPDSKTNIVF